MNRKKKIAVLFGGQSTEHEVSRLSAQSVIRNIDKDKYDIAMVGITRDGKWLSYDGPVEKIGTGEWEEFARGKLMSSKEKVQQIDGNNPGDSLKSLVGINEEDRGIDVIFPVLHGSNGEDGTIQGLFELADLPYVGSGVLGSALAMDKAYAKIIFERVGIPTAAFLVFNRKQLSGNQEDVISKIESTFKYPCFIKPANAGSSVGITKAHDRQELIEGLSYAARYDKKILIEEFINGREIECAVLGNDEPVASAVGEVVPCNEFYDYNAKYIDDKSQIIIPANLSEDAIGRIRDYAVKAYAALECAGMARVDFFVSRETGDIFINEINTLPGFTKISMYPQLWEASGVSYQELINKLIELALERFDDNRKEVIYGGK